MCSHTHITEREMSTERHAHTVARQTMDEIHRAADAEDAETQSASMSEVVYDLNGRSYRKILGSSVPDTADTSIRFQRWAEKCVERTEHQIRFKDEAYASYTAAMDIASGEGCPLAPVHVGSGNINWGSLTASEA